MFSTGYGGTSLMRDALWTIAPFICFVLGGGLLWAYVIEPALPFHCKKCNWKGKRGKLELGPGGIGTVCPRCTSEA